MDDVRSVKQKLTGAQTSIQAADENIAHSTRSTNFIAPRSADERRLRNAVLSLAPNAEFARRIQRSFIYRC